ncbi:MAG: hypothetical protein ACRERC_16170 [Candidatus Binatia bacterium]
MTETPPNVAHDVTRLEHATGHLLGQLQAMLGQRGTFPPDHIDSAAFGLLDAALTLERSVRAVAAAHITVAAAEPH